MTASTLADVFSFVRLAKPISWVILPWDDRFVFVLAFSEWPCIVFYRQHICKLRYKFDVTACIQRLLISALRRMRQTKLPKEPRFVTFLSSDPWKEFGWHCIWKWKISTNFPYYSCHVMLQEQWVRWVNTKRFSFQCNFYWRSSHHR